MRRGRRRIFREENIFDLWNGLIHLLTNDERAKLALRNVKANKSFNSQAAYVKRLNKTEAVRRLATRIVRHSRSGAPAPLDPKLQPG